MYYFRRHYTKFSFTVEGIIMYIKIFSGEGQTFFLKIVPGTKIFTENFVPPDQTFLEQNSSDIYVAIIVGVETFNY